MKLIKAVVGTSLVLVAVLSVRNSWIQNESARDASSAIKLPSHSRAAYPENFEPKPFYKRAVVPRERSSVHPSISSAIASTGRSEGVVLRAQGEKIPVSNYFQSYELNDESAKSMRQAMRSLSGGASDVSDSKPIVMFEPANSDETKVPFSKLTTDCPVLAQVPVPLSIEISGSGGVLDVLPAIQSYQVPAALYSCQFANGPGTNFNTVYTPASPMAKRQPAGEGP